MNPVTFTVARYFKIQVRKEMHALHVAVIHPIKRSVTFVIYIIADFTFYLDLKIGGIPAPLSNLEDVFSKVCITL